MPYQICPDYGYAGRPLYPGPSGPFRCPPCAPHYWPLTSEWRGTSCDQPARQNVPAVRAVKEIYIEAATSDKVEYLRELEAIMEFSQSRYTPFFVQSFGWFEGPESVYSAMEYIANGDLQQYLKHPIPERETQIVALQLAEGLEHMHTNGFTHRDLKPKNILIVCGSPNWLVQISDFGISKRLQSDQATLSTIRRGTMGFIAPEMLGYVKERGYPHAVDIWSFGAVMYRMLTNRELLAEFSLLQEYAVGKAKLTDRGPRLLWRHVVSSGPSW